MADIIDEHGNPIQLTDELGRPVKLTDEHGDPIHLTGVATVVDSGPHGGAGIMGSETHGGTHFAPVPAEAAGVEHTLPAGNGAPLSHPPETGENKQLGRTDTSSSSSSSEDDGEGGRRPKKKGLMQKIKEKLPGHKNKEGEAAPAPAPTMVYTSTTKVTMTTPAGAPADEQVPENILVEHYEEEHEAKKKGFMDKVKEKLPGHRTH